MLWVEKNKNNRVAVVMYIDYVFITITNGCHNTRDVSGLGSVYDRVFRKHALSCQLAQSAECTPSTAHKNELQLANNVYIPTYLSYDLAKNNTRILCMRLVSRNVFQRLAVA